MNELAYVLITPYSLLKSRTGGIIARILTNNDLELRAVKMYAPSNEMVDDYVKAVSQDRLSDHNRELFCGYIRNNLRTDNPSMISNRCVLLVFEGDNAANIIKRGVGYITYKSKGDTVRTTYGDYITHGDKIVYFEPAVLCAPDSDAAKIHLRVFKKYAGSDGGVITEALSTHIKDKNCETTLVMVKPDNFKRKSARPGVIIDSFSRTGLYIVGAKLVRFSIAQATEFYKPLKSIFEVKFEGFVRREIEEAFQNSLSFPVDAENLDSIARRLRKNNANYSFDRIIEYITGLDPATIKKSERKIPGKERCLVLLYHGVNAIEKIRTLLGATDPRAADGGTVRSDFGQDVLKNGVHASDSIKNALRERKIVGLLGKEKSELDEIIPY